MKTIRAKHAFFILAIIVLFHFISNLIWLREGPCLYGKDVAGHLKVGTTIYYRLLSALHGPEEPHVLLSGIVSLLRERPLPFLGGAWTWPKLFYIYTALMNLSFGLIPLVTILSNIPVLALLIVSIYCLGAGLGDRRAGLLAAFLVSFYPAVFGLSRKYGLDFPLAAMVAFSIAVSVRTRGFYAKGKSVLLGFIVGLGILVKGQIVLFLAGPFLVELVTHLVSERSGRGRRMLHFFLMVAISLLVSSVWWWGIAGELCHSYFGHVEEDLSLPLNLTFPAYSFGWWTFYLFYSIIDISPLLFIFFVIGLPLFLFSRVAHKWTLVAWIVVPYIIWTFTFQKSYLYFFPSYATFALITALGIMRIRRKRLRRFVLVIIVLSSMIQFWQLSFADVRLVDLPVKKLINPDGYYTVYHPPVGNNYQEVLQEFIAEIDRQVGDTSYIRIGMLELESSIWQENTSDTLDYYMRLEDPAFSLYRSHFTRQSFVVNCESFAYLIVMSRGAIRDAVEETRRYYMENPGRRSLVESIWGARAFEDALRRYENYEVLREEVLYPGNIRLSLCRQPPVDVSAAGALDAVRFFAAKVVVHPPFVTSARALAYPLTIEDSDMLFPLEPSLAAKGPDFVEYILYSQAPAERDLELEYAAPGGSLLSIRVDGVPVLSGVSLPAGGTAGPSGWHTGALGAILLKGGESTMRIEAVSLPSMRRIGLRSR